MFGEINGEAVDRTNKVLERLPFAKDEYDDAVTLQSNKTFSFLRRSVGGQRSSVVLASTTLYKHAP